MREELREANQARGAGMQLGGSGKGVDSLDESAWLAQVRAGRKKQAVVRDAEEVFQVLTPTIPIHVVVARQVFQDVFKGKGCCCCEDVITCTVSLWLPLHSDATAG